MSNLFTQAFFRYVLYICSTIPQRKQASSQVRSFANTSCERQALRNVVLRTFPLQGVLVSAFSIRSCWRARRARVVLWFKKSGVKSTCRSWFKATAQTVCQTRRPRSVFVRRVDPFAVAALVQMRHSSISPLPFTPALFEKPQAYGDRLCGTRVESFFLYCFMFSESNDRMSNKCFFFNARWSHSSVFTIFSINFR